jgi:hypothetical protein
VLTKDPRMSEVRTLRDVPEHILREISQFFQQYKARVVSLYVCLSVPVCVCLWLLSLKRPPPGVHRSIHPSISPSIHPCHQL